ncbi:MAG: DUF1574 domain-containing protein [Leptospira sp.]|nr:DUF1574 domain-containing protein [Leptospira sp.]
MRSKFLGLGIAFLFFVILEVTVRITDIHYLEQPEIFFVNLKKRFVESGTGTADIVILGDSRSMALAGYKKGDGSQYEIYNHSLPAMGPKYYRFFLEKYLQKGNKKPKLVLFAASPKLYSVGYGPPLYDPDGKSVKQNESISEYFNRRFKEGIEKNFFRPPTPNTIISYSGKQDDANQILWEFFGHRYLHQFTLGELWSQYDGVERLFITAKALPMTYHSYRFRGAIRNTLSLNDWTVESNYKEKSLFCESCEAIEQGLCVPPNSQRQDNLMIEDQIERHLGKYNISNRVKPEIVYFAREQRAKAMLAESKEPVPSSFPEPNFIVLDDLIQFTKEKGIEFAFVYMPWMEVREESPETQFRLAKLKAYFQTHPEVGVFFFPRSSYPSEQFVDDIHYDCRGEKRVNQEFKEYILPKIVRFLDSKQKSN